MLPSGFLGTRGDILMDLVILSFIIILPVLFFSWWQVRHAHYQTHKRTQLWLGGTLAVAVILFEIDIRMNGGTFALVAPSPYAEAWWLTAIIYVHLLIAVLTSLIWAGLIVMSLRRFDRPPAPGAFSATHRLWGRAGMVAMTLTGLTAYPLYFFGFAA
jgi:putative membrane protein